MSTMMKSSESVAVGIVVSMEVDGRKLFVRVQRLLHKANDRCFKCGGHAAKTTLEIVEVHEKESEVVGKDLAAILTKIKEQLTEHPSAVPVCAARECDHEFVEILQHSCVA